MTACHGAAATLQRIRASICMEGLDMTQPKLFARVFRLGQRGPASRQPEALEQLAGNLITAVFDGMPDFKTSKQSSTQPPKAK
eukprot:scaffold596257_cov47-Prasinocladus_malaysianus.AAC.2